MRLVHRVVMTMTMAMTVGCMITVAAMLMRRAVHRLSFRQIVSSRVQPCSGSSLAGHSTPFERAALLHRYCAHPVPPSDPRAS
jgi:hypothetical protein